MIQSDIIYIRIGGVNMLLNFNVNNFCSFKNHASLSMKPGKVIARFEDNVVTFNPRLKVLRTAVIVGENAGGKTSFIRSLHFFKYLFEKDSFPRMIKNLSFNYNSENTQSFEISVLECDRIYTYKLSIDFYGIVSEQLMIRKYSQSASSNKLVFNVNRMNFSKSNDSAKLSVTTEYKVDIEDSFIDDELMNIIWTKWDNKSLFLNYLSLIGVEIVIPLTNWIKERLLIELPRDLSLNIYKQMEKDEEDLQIIKTQTFFEIFTLVDSSIAKIEINEEEPYEKTIIIRKTKNNEDFKIELKNESSGTREFFAWAIQIWKVLYKNKILFADEVDRVLNSILSEKIVTLIQGTEHQGQFIFSTHNVLHLNTNNFMKEQLYFITKEKETFASEMYSLSDFKSYRYQKPDVYSLYLKGILGGVPND